MNKSSLDIKTAAGKGARLCKKKKKKSNELLPEAGMKKPVCFVFRGSSVNFQMIYKPWILFISRTMLFMQAVHTTPSPFSLVR